MQTKKIRYRLFFLLCLMCIFSLGLWFSPSIELHDTSVVSTPKSSAGEITIATPQNKTYTVPDSGYYPGTYGFESDLNGAIPFNWVDTSTSPCYTKIVDNIGGHNKVIEVYGRGQTSSDYANIFNYFQPQTNGTIEWWWRKSSTLSSCAKFYISDDILPIIDFRMDWYADPGKIEYYSSGWTNTGYTDYADDKWIHMKLSFDCTTDDFNLTIDGVLYLTNTPFSGGYTADHIDNLKFYTYAASNPTLYFVDAVGYSWDPNYNIGDNLNEGLLMSYDNTTTLDWQGYSLDGQANKTISGNTTISMPADGSHTIQAFGNNSIGTMYESITRYFSVDTSPYIKIVTPENKTYTEPDSGYYPGTFGFENEIDGTTGTSINFVDTETNQGSSYVKVISDLDGHDKVLEAYDGSSAGRNQITHNFSSTNQVSGTIEFYWRITTTSYGANLYFYGTGASGTNGLHLGMESGYFVYRDASDVQQNIVSYSVNTWYHIRIDFECDSGGYMGLAADRWHVYIDDVLYGDYVFRYGRDLDDQDSLLFYNGWWSGSGYNIYYDAWGESWDPNYNIGDNIDEGLLLSFENSTALDWLGFSLDGQANKTILGNSTIPMPTDGFHNIQVFGNNSIGTMIESDTRYFTMNAMSPDITIISPISSQLYGTTPPDYSLTIIDSDLDARWYSLDGGTTNVLFSGLTGTIDQIEWDKIGNGTATITFYANDTLNNIGQAEVTIKKDMLGPLITVNSPIDSQVFGKVAPSFDLAILENQINATWYTLDYGSVNITFSGLAGNIDQTEWAKKGGGSVPIMFYANDSLGNEDFSEVIVVKDIISPIIAINSPNNNELFGSIPPTFDLTLTESNTDSLWYTLDSGATNLTLSSLTGTIDQTEWNNQGNGTVTIRFYAEDKGGNGGFAEIIVRKDVNIPLITINSPNTNDIAGLLPLIYDISVVEPNIDSMWYSLDFGATNVTFGSLTGTIDQTEWDKFGDGLVIIRFYVRDKSDNEAYTEVQVNKDLVAPVITIIAPQFGGVFLDFTPLYSISIDEPNLDSFWYSLDGGTTNITITALSDAISESVWNTLPNGHVTLTFYAKDEGGNIGQISVLITKDTTEEPPAPPPGIPGYDLYLLIGTISVISTLLIRKRLKS